MAWVHLGTWVLTSTLAAEPTLGGTGPRTGIHNVYTQGESLKLYKQNRKWPDGAVVVTGYAKSNGTICPRGTLSERARLPNGSS
jgi:hypothetical protein